MPGATVRSWEKRGLVPADPALAGHHRHLWAIDVFHIGLLREFLAGGFSADNAMAMAAAVIYGDSDTELRRELRTPSPARIQACQRDYHQVWPDVRHRDEASPYWVVYKIGETAPGAVLPWPEASRLTQSLRHFGSINLTRFISAIERDLSRLSAERTGNNG